MTEPKKSPAENKPQQTEQPKPTPIPPTERNLRTGWVAVGDSAENIRKGK